MYHDEKVIDGVLHWRGTSNGEWKPYSAEQLTRLLWQTRTRADSLGRQLQENQDAVEVRDKVRDKVREILRLCMPDRS